jgi:hypothetical protein
MARAVRRRSERPRKQAIVEAAALVAELRRHLAVAERHLDDLLAGHAPRAEGAAVARMSLKGDRPQARRRGRQGPRSLASLILEKGDTGAELQANELAADFEIADPQKVRLELGRLYRKGELSRVAKGVYLRKKASAGPPAHGTESRNG